MNEIELTGKHVKYVLRNGMVLEGVVEKDTAAEVVLKSLDGKSLMILHRPTEDILLTKVVLAEDAPEKVVEEKDGRTHQIRELVNEVIKPNGEPDIQAMNLKQLRSLVIEQERQLIEQKRKEHFPTQRSGVSKYSSPYMPRPHPRSNQARSAYQPGTLPHWVYGRPPAKGR